MRHVQLQRLAKDLIRLERHLPNAKTMLVTAVNPWKRLVLTVASTGPPLSCTPTAIMVIITADKMLINAGMDQLASKNANHKRMPN